MTRWLAAAGGSIRRVEEGSAGPCEPGQSSRGQLIGHDIFRRGYVHFQMYGRLLRLRSSLPAGIMHWTYPVPLVMEGWTNLYTVHDAIPLTRPDLTPISPRRHRALLRALMTRAHRLVTVSECARGEIVAALACNPDKVVNCGQSVDFDVVARAFLPTGLAAKHYLLFCGSIEPRKNLSALLTAYGRSGTALPLVIAGPDGWRAEPILRQIAGTAGVIRLPYLDRDQLLALIQGARAMLFPSLAEGFGLPVAESMALGTAVMTSNRGALAEIAGGAGLLVDPDDPASIADGIVRLAEDDGLVRRLAELGRQHAPVFSRDAFATRLAAVYGEAFANDP